MATPSYTKSPRLPQDPSPNVENHRCGEHWGEFPIRAPYRNIDAFQEKMPRVPIDPASDIMGPGHELRDAAVVFGKLIDNGAMDDAVAHAETALAGHTIDSANRRLLTKYLDRARDYADQANRVAEFLYPSGTASTAGPVNMSPPTALEYCTALTELAVAAVSNARCVSEAAIAVGIHNKNKKKAGGDKGILYAPKKKSEPPIIGEPLPEPEPEPEPEPQKPAKKKDNTMLMVGAAAAGLFLLSRR